jgi:hypothetical protein
MVVEMQVEYQDNESSTQLTLLKNKGKVRMVKVKVVV